MKTQWHGRIDAAEGKEGYRWHQFVKPGSVSLPSLHKGQKGVAFLGFCSDEGVRRNQGRQGAADGPAALRKAMSNLALHLPEDRILLADTGDVACKGGSLEKAQRILADKVKNIVAGNYMPVLLGGGHEIAWPHFLGIAEAAIEKKTARKVRKIGVLNFDAHFDLRPATGGATSGTPFLQMAEFCKKSKMPFSYFCVGIQPAANTRALFKRAEQLKVNYLTADEIRAKGEKTVRTAIKKFMDKNDAVYVTVCLDVFDVVHAPGVSAPSVMGLTPVFVAEQLKFIARSGRLISMDIAELSPPLDIDSRTAKLGARLIYEVVSSL